MRVADLIDKDAGCWREEMVRQTFLPLDAELVLRIPLCTSWPEDKLIWHFTSNGVFLVRSAYHLIRSIRRSDTPSSSGDLGKSIWKVIWALDVPPRIQLFEWRVRVQVLAIRSNIARRIPNFDMKCEICGHLEDSDSHTLFECSLAIEMEGK